MRILRVLRSLPISSCLTLIPKSESGTKPEGCETFRIVFDAEHKVSIQLGITAGMLVTNQFPHMKASRISPDSAKQVR